MANHVKISTFSTCSPEAGPLRGRDAVEAMRRFWEQNLAKVTPDRPDLIVLPEVCDQFSDIPRDEQPEYLAARGDAMLQFFAETARNHRCYIAYSALRTLKDGSWRNSIRMIDRNGNVCGCYDKNHLYLEEYEYLSIQRGPDAQTIQTDFGSVACMICFDLNFESLIQKYKPQQPDLVLFSSMYHGGIMQQYWAYKLRAHLVSAVQGLPSHFISPAGQITAGTTNYFDTATQQLNLDCQTVHFDFNMEKLRKLKHAYGTNVILSDPGYLGSFIVYSNSDTVSAAHMLEEFEIEPLDTYLDRAEKRNRNPAQ